MAHIIPGAPDLIARYPAFAAVATATVDIYISDAAAQGVDTSWSESRYGRAIMALAAHRMQLLGIGEHGDVAGFKQQGVNRIRSGAFDASFNEAAVAKASAGGLDATVYGREYKQMLRAERGGPRLIGGGVRPDGFGPLHQLNYGGVTPWDY